MAMHGCLHTGSNIASYCLTRKWVIGWIRIKCYDDQALHSNMGNRDERILQAEQNKERSMTIMRTFRCTK